MSYPKEEQVVPGFDLSHITQEHWGKWVFLHPKTAEVLAFANTIEAAEKQLADDDVTPVLYKPSTPPFAATS